MSSLADKQNDYPQPIKGESYQHFEARVNKHLWEQKPPCSVSERIKARIDASTQKGIGKYGQTLDRTDLTLRDWLDHALQECLDQAKYLQKAIDELDGDNRA
jgi:hypothetical protein